MSGALFDYKGYYKVLGIAQDADLQAVVDSYNKVWLSLSYLKGILELRLEFESEDLSQLMQNLTSVAEIARVEIPKTKFICDFIQEKLIELNRSLTKITDTKVIKEQAKFVFTNLLGYVEPQLELNEMAHAVLTDEDKRKLYDTSKIRSLFFTAQVSSELLFLSRDVANLIIGYAYEDPEDPANKPDEKLTLS